MVKNSGLEQFFAPCRFGAALSAQTALNGNRLKLSKDTIKKAKELEWFRGTMLMELRNKGIVSDPNNMIGIIFDYATIHPELSTPTAQQKEVANNPSMVPKTFDFGAFAGMAAGLIDAIITGVDSGNTQAFLQNWARQFAQYMTDDFGSINATLTATNENRGAWGGYGAKGALDMLLRFKSTSWKELKNSITNYCSNKHIDIPQPVRDLWQQQVDLETDLRRQIASGQNVGAASDPSVSGQSLTGYGSGNGGGYFPALSGNFMKYLPWIIVALVVLIIIIIAVMGLRGSRVTVKK